MKISYFVRDVLGGLSAAAFLTACGGSQPPIGAPGAMPQSRAIATQAQRGGSWIVREGVRHNLLYVSNGASVYVYSYPKLRLLGMLAPFDDVWGECVDRAGDVFIVDYYYGAYEYAHGGTAPIASLYNPGGRSIGCSIDPTSGDLAISGGESESTVVTIFKYSAKRGWRYSKLYSDSAFTFAFYCGYDAKGNLFVDGLPIGSGTFILAELPKGGSSFANITLDRTFQGPGGVQWDGKQMTVGDSQSSPPTVYQFTVKDNLGTVVGSTALADSTLVHDYWIQEGTLVGADYDGNDFSFWSFPRGGNPTKTLSLNQARAVVVSLK